MIRPIATAALFAAATPTLAEVPRVATDIAPVHALVARVMEGAGTPAQVVPGSASPHHHALRPSEAQALQDADIVFHVSYDLSPWLESPIRALAGDAQVITLFDAEGTIRLPYRTGATFEAHDHDHDHGHDHHDHDHRHDSHAWLDPENGKLWLDTIAATLSAADPENAALYAANAQAGKAEIDQITAEIQILLAPVRDRQFVVFHDAYQYFESRFGLAAAGAISLGDATDPSPARLREIRGAIAALSPACIFAEPQFNPNLIATVTEGSDIPTGILDPLGTDLAQGPALYGQMLRNLAQTLASCGQDA
ncbi:MAG: zinc ABC transporter substrate-binding protein [Paracoccaceae bacterium]